MISTEVEKNNSGSYETESMIFTSSETYVRNFGFLLCSCQFAGKSFAKFFPEKLPAGQRAKNFARGKLPHPRAPLPASLFVLKDNKPAVALQIGARSGGRPASRNNFISPQNSFRKKNFRELSLKGETFNDTTLI